MPAINMKEEEFPNLYRFTLIYIDLISNFRAISPPKCNINFLFNTGSCDSRPDVLCYCAANNFPTGQ